MFFVNFNIESTNGFQYVIEKRKGTYDFIPTEPEWVGEIRGRTVGRIAEFTRLTSREPDGDSVTFYYSAFNLQGIY